MADAGARRGEKLVDLRRSLRRPLLRTLAGIFEYPLERALGLAEVNAAWRRATHAVSVESFFTVALEALNIRYVVAPEDVAKIPTAGPVVLVCNHPFGALEGLVLGDILLQVRPDMRFLGNFLLHRLAPMRPWVFAVDPFDGASPRANATALKQAVRWTEQGGLLVTWPAGAVSHLTLRSRRVSDPPWSPHVAAIIRRAKASVLPAYFPGRNSLLFQSLGLVHPALRTVLLPRELVRRQSSSARVFFGNPIPWSSLADFASDEEMIRFLRVTTYFLAHRARRGPTGLRRMIRPRQRRAAPEPIIPPTDPAALRAEVAALPPECLLDAGRDLAVYILRAHQAPALLREIARLREITFREVGEGTGKALDTDRFDATYLHLVLWNREKGEIVGAYRLGLIDEILRESGPEGLYTSTLFKFKPGLMEHLVNGIELGRSFIRSEYQKQTSCLAMLWRGIGEFIVRNPKYHILFGPVSISQNYHVVSKDLIVQFLRWNLLHPEYARYVRPRRPYRRGRRRGLDRKSLRSVLRDIEDVSLLVSGIEKGGRGIPVLLRQYLKLNAMLISFNVDKRFSGVVDGLILVDLTTTDPRLCRRFMTKAGYETFRAHHAEAFARSAGAD